ncbi:MAG: dihydrodipicolinate reductase [Desulfobacterales bacterium]
MNTIKVVVNGIPGKVACTVAARVQADARFELLPVSLTGPEIRLAEHAVAGVSIALIQPAARGDAMESIRARHGRFLTVDYTHPSAVNPNAQFYCRTGLPFVMGTTGGDRAALEETVRRSDTAAVVAPNMAKQIVGFQAMMEYAADTFPGLFQGYTLEIRESHQQGKADTSGTAKAMVRYFNRLGIPFTEEQIVMERDPEVQKARWGVPGQHLSGHGWHTYTLVSADRTARFEFTHNINGREIYALGTLDALVYLQGKLDEGARGKLFTMIDVLKRA